MVAGKGQCRSLEAQLRKHGGARRKLGRAYQDNARENFSGSQVQSNPRASTQGSPSRCEVVKANVDHWRGDKPCCRSEYLAARDLFDFDALQIYRGSFTGARLLYNVAMT